MKVTVLQHRDGYLYIDGEQYKNSEYFGLASSARHWINENFKDKLSKIDDKMIENGQISGLFWYDDMVNILRKLGFIVIEKEIFKDIAVLIIENEEIQT